MIIILSTIIWHEGIVVLHLNHLSNYMTGTCMYMLVCHGYAHHLVIEGSTSYFLQAYALILSPITTLECRPTWYLYLFIILICVTELRWAITNNNNYYTPSQTWAYRSVQIK